MKKISLISAAAAMVMLLSVSLGSTLAYFTAAAQGETTASITLGASSHIDENIGDDLSKSVTVTNDGATEIMVRVMVTGDYISGISGDGWTQADGYWQYSGILEPEAVTSVLTITPDLAAAAEAQAGFSIAVTEEYGQIVEIDGVKTVDWTAAATAEEAE